MAPNSWSLQDSVVRSGNQALQITLKPGDMLNPASASGAASERDELSEAKGLHSVEGRFYSYKFSMFLPQDFPIVPTRLVLAQWKQVCPVAHCTRDNPVIALRYVNGELYITVQKNNHKRTLYRAKKEFRGQWLDFEFQIRFSAMANGLLRVVLNGDKIVNHRGFNAYSGGFGYSGTSSFYFKMGLYRDLMPEPMTVYFDDYQKRELFDLTALN
jgi:hypothetical protein